MEDHLLAQKDQLDRALLSVEREILDLETTYLVENASNVVHGWDGQPKASSSLRKGRIAKEHRIFSLSSVTAPLPTDQADAAEVVDGGSAAVDGRKRDAMGPPKGGRKKRRGGSR